MYIQKHNQTPKAYNEIQISKSENILLHLSLWYKKNKKLKKKNKALKDKS